MAHIDMESSQPHNNVKEIVKQIKLLFIKTITMDKEKKPKEKRR